MSWFDDVADYILDHLDDYADRFLKPHEVKTSGKSIFINPCPSCGHNGCFTLTKGKNMANCFSCGESGTLIQIVENLYGEVEGRRMLADFTGKTYNFASFEPEKAAEKEKFDRFQRICHKAIDFYHGRLMANRPVSDGFETKKPLDYQMNVRKHKVDTLVKYKVGYSGDFGALYKLLLEEGFEADEIKEATRQLIGLPEGYFVYPYFDSKGNLIRINCKMFVRVCRGKEKKGGGFHYDCDFKSFRKDNVAKDLHENQTGHKMASENLSRGEKTNAFFFHPKDARSKTKKYLILVEGENDVLSTEEGLENLPASYQKYFSVAGTGGSATQGLFEAEFLRQFDEVYEAFDNDDAGDKYREQLDREMPDVPLKRLEIPLEHNDIDEYLKLDEMAIDAFRDMIDDAKIQTTQNYKIVRDHPKHHWEMKNRHYALRYEMDYYDGRKKGFSGNLLIFRNQLQTDKKVGDIDTIKVPGEELTRLKVALSARLLSYYHDIRWVDDEPQRSFDELLDIFRLTKQKFEVSKQIAWYVFHAPPPEYEVKIREIQRRIRNETDIANILKEVNGYENQEINPYAHFPKIQLSQSFFPRNGDGYLYFAKFVKDGEIPKRVPCLISNKREEIRLDLLRRKDSQCMLLINNKYELPMEVPTNFADVEDLSLQYEWVNKWVNDEVDDAELHPSTIIREIEAFIRSTYYTSDDVVKVLSVWIYATYFYTLFKNGFPYLVFNGAKGTGKSTLDAIVHLLAFNPTFAVSISGAALYRQVSVFGGTFILDELETMSDSAKVNESDVAAVIKAGYSDKGKVYRMDKDNMMAEGFSAFGPKVISNITGVEDVIGDRCIFIETHAAPQEKLNALLDIDEFKGERRTEMYSVTSRAALSALTHFPQVQRIFATDNRIDTGNARLTQILRPLVTIAKLVGGDYEKHLMSYYYNDIKEKKEDIAMETVEGKIKYIMISISEEILGLSKTKWVLYGEHMYDKPISFDKKSGMFELDDMHLKVLIEELDSQRNYELKEIRVALKNVLGKNFDMNERRTTTKLTINDEGLQRIMNHKKHVHGNRYKLNVRQFITKQTEKIKYSNAEENAEVLF